MWAVVIYGFKCEWTESGYTEHADVVKFDEGYNMLQLMQLMYEGHDVKSVSPYSTKKKAVEVADKFNLK